MFCCLSCVVAIYPTLPLLVYWRGLFYPKTFSPYIPWVSLAPPYPTLVA